MQISQKLPKFLRSYLYITPILKAVLIFISPSGHLIKGVKKLKTTHHRQISPSLLAIISVNVERI